MTEMLEIIEHFKKKICYHALQKKKKKEKFKSSVLTRRCFLMQTVQKAACYVGDIAFSSAAWKAANKFFLEKIGSQSSGSPGNSMCHASV